MTYDLRGQGLLVGAAKQYRKDRRASLYRKSERADNLRHGFRKVEPARPRRTQSDAHDWARQAGNELPGATSFIGWQCEAELNRRRRQAKQIAEGLILQQLEPHRRLRLDSASREQMIEFLGIRGREQIGRASCR